MGAETTASVFGRELHSYVITDAIRDEKVLKFKVDYNDVRPKFKSLETELDDKKLSSNNFLTLVYCEASNLFIITLNRYIVNKNKQINQMLKENALI